MPDRRQAAGMVMREAKPVLRTPNAKRLGASRVSRSRMAMTDASVADASRVGLKKNQSARYTERSFPTGSMQYIYTMKGLGKVHPPDSVVLKDIWLSFLPGAKIGVLGLNGSGKSTPLRIMAGEDRDFVGEAWPAEGITVGFLPQEPRLDASKDVRGNVEEGVAEIKALLT